MKIQDQPVLKVVAITFICLLFYSVFMVKLFGSTEVTSDVEKNGFCKQFGEDWKNDRGTNECFNKHSSNRKSFTDEEFRIHCPKNKLISNKFYSHCFYKSGSIV